MESPSRLHPRTAPVGFNGAMTSRPWRADGTWELNQTPVLLQWSHDLAAMERVDEGRLDVGGGRASMEP